MIECDSGCTCGSVAQNKIAPSLYRDVSDEVPPALLESRDGSLDLTVVVPAYNEEVCDIPHEPRMVDTSNAFTSPCHMLPPSLP